MLPICYLSPSFLTKKKYYLREILPEISLKNSIFFFIKKKKRKKEIVYFFNFKEKKLEIFWEDFRLETYVHLFLSKKINSSNRLATLKYFKTWLGHITNFHFGRKIEK
jgi:hypothetical protein